MLMLPDYADRVIAEHKLRVEKSVIIGIFLLIISGGWWLFINLENDKDIVFRYGPVILMFMSAFILPELMNYGPKSRSKIASMINIIWPCILSFTLTEYINSFNYVISAIILLSIVLFLWAVTNNILGLNLSTKRLRGITSIVGLAISLPILSSTDNIYLWIILILSISITMVPDLIKKDSEYLDRKRFSKELDLAEFKLLKLKSEGNNVQQSSSILKVAREEGFDNPIMGLKSIEDALNNAERMMALSKDIEEIRQESLSKLNMMENITLDTKISRNLFTLGDEEFTLGSLREAELLYRKSKEKATEIEKYWQDASDIISESKLILDNFNEHQAKSVIGILNSAKDALLREDPKEAIQIAESIQYHIKNMGHDEEIISNLIANVEKSLTKFESGIIDNSNNRIKEAKEAVKLGDYSLAKGLTDSIQREISLTSESKLKVQKALRQKVKIESRFPSGNSRKEWEIKLENIILKSNSGSWADASEELDILTNSLRDYEFEVKETKELLLFIQDNLEKLRPKLDSSGIDIGDEMRLLTEQSVANATKFFEEGDIKNCLSQMAKSDELFENIRRRI